MNTATRPLRRHSRLIDGIWLFLMLATGATWLAAEQGQAAHFATQFAPHFTPLALVGFVFALALVKGGLVALEFMELRHAPALWRWIVLGWLLVVIAFILLAYQIGLA